MNDTRHFSSALLVLIALYAAALFTSLAAAQPAVPTGLESWWRGNGDATDEQASSFDGVDDTVALGTTSSFRQDLRTLSL